MQKRVLLIEDEPNIIEAIRFILTRDGWQVASHSDGLSAIEAIRDVKPDVLVLDVMLPGRSGYEILADIRGNPDLAVLKVLVLTAAGQGHQREAAERAGADMFLAKPFSNTEMLDAVRRLGGTP